MNTQIILTIALAMLINSNSYAANATSNSYKYLIPQEQIPSIDGQPKSKAAPKKLTPQEEQQRVYPLIRSLTAKLQNIRKNPRLEEALNTILQKNYALLQTIADPKTRTVYTKGYSDIVQQIASIMGVKVNLQTNTVAFPPIARAAVYIPQAPQQPSTGTRLTSSEQDLYDWIQKTVAPALTTIEKNEQLQELLSTLFQTNKAVFQKMDDYWGSTVYVPGYVSMLQQFADTMGLLLDEQSGMITSKKAIEQELAEQALKTTL